MRGRNPENPSDRTAGIPTEQRIEVGGDVANCITSVQKDSMVVEPNVLTPKRTEYGKQVRKMYESGDLKESRHNMTEMQPRKDGISNTITSVQKDNILAEPNITEDNLNEVCRVIEWKGKTLHEGDGLYLATTENFFRAGLSNVSRTLKANVHDAGVVQNYRIRKLTERECFRLMGVSDSDIDKIQSAGISKTQQYKLAGNSIVVDVLFYIFKNLFAL